MKNAIGTVCLVIMLAISSCNNSGTEDVKVKREVNTTEKNIPEKRTVIEVPVPLPPPSPKEVLKNLPKPPSPREVLRNLPKPPLPPPPPPLPKPRG